MKIARILLLAWFALLQKSSSSLNCPLMPHFDPHLCVCNPRFSSDRTGGWEMTCFSDNTQRHAVIIDYAVNKHILVQCASVTLPYATAMFSAFNATEIGTFKFQSCQLPNVSFGDILRDQKVYSFTFESRKNLTDLTSEYFENMKDLKVLVLRRNGLTNLPRNLFTNLRELRDLRLNENRLQQIYEDSFHNLANLSNLELGGNLIHKLPENVFSHLHDLKSLYLYNNKLVNISENIFRSLQSLATLELSSNLLEDIPTTLLEGLRSLERISLRGNRLKNLPSGLFRSLTLLLLLDLSNNPQLQSLPEHLFSGLSKLEYISVEGCSLTSISPNLFSSLTNLKTLKMGHNKITELHPNLFRNNSNMRILLLDFNYLETLTKNLFEFQYLLTTLGLSRNNLRELPSGIFRNLVKLTSLNMAFNNISYLNWDILTSLQYLETLNLNNNKLKRISNFGLSSNLKKADLSNNLLISMPEIKAGIHLQIQEINLEYNNISFLEVPVVLSGTASIRLGWNNINTINIDDLVMIYNLNKLSEPDPTSQKRILKSSPRFYLFPNPIHCDCQISHFVSYITAKPDQYSDQVQLAVFPFSQNLICNQPSYLTGKQLSVLSTSDFVCPTMKDCPLPCSCYRTTQGDKLVMNCSYRGLKNLPSTAPLNTNILNIAGNELHSLDGLNEPHWENLTELHLTDNSLSDFGAWNFKQNLTYISLERNALSNLPEEFMSYISSTSELKISLGHNPWSCSCSIIDMKGWLIENIQKISDVNNVYCINNMINKSQVSVLRASKEILCPPDTWQHTRQLILVCCLVIIISFVLFLTLILYYRNRRNLKVIFSGHSHLFYGERWLWRKLRYIVNRKTKSIPVQNDIGLCSNGTNQNLINFVENRISSLNYVPKSRIEDKPVRDNHPVTTNSTNIAETDIACIECTLEPKYVFDSATV